MSTICTTEACYSRWDLNPHTLRQLILSQPCLPLHHLSMIFTLRGTCTLNPSRQLGLNQSCILNSTTRAYMTRKDGIEPSTCRFSVCRYYQLSYFHIKEQITGFEPVTSCLEGRRDKPTTLNLHKSSPIRTRTQDFCSRGRCFTT